jgi:1-acyl-sn-glycerol-3-phosphate acyltransferase
VIRTALLVLLLPVYAVLASLLGYPLARLRGSPRLLYTLGRLGARASFRLVGVRIELLGMDKLSDPCNAVLMPNHASHLDAAILFGLIPLELKAVVKRELYRFPFVHYCMHYAGFIDIDRKDPVQSKDAIARAVASLKAGATFVIFPEGTRSRMGELGEFKKGAFVVAIDAGSRIVPVAVRGARELMPRGAWRVRSGTVEVRVLDPVDAGAYSYEDRDRLIGEVRARIGAALAG